MTNIRVLCLVATLLTGLAALNAQSVNPAVTVPRTVRYTGSFHPTDGLPIQPMEGVTVAVYADQTGGDPLWQETQNVQVDASGTFVLEMGVTQNEGLPLDLLRSGEPRWVGMRVNRSGEAEQPRVRLLSVPYALRASDAETLGGLPASAYLVNPSVASAVASPGGATTAAAGVPGAKTVKPHVTSGNTNYIGVFTNTTDLGNSVMFQNNSKIGLNTTTPADFMHVAFNDASGSVTGYAVQNLGSGAASFSGMLFYDQNGALGQFQGFNNSTHEYRINNIASNASINFMLGSASKFQLQPSGDINIAGSIRRGNTLFLHSLGNANTALGLSALSNSTTGGQNTAMGGAALQSNTTGVNDTAVGFVALSANTTGTENTAIGAGVLQNNTTGGANTAGGFQSLFSNTTGGGNTALGWGALFSNTTANQNTAVGQTALQHNTTGGNNTALGVNTLQQNTTGANNTASGANALLNNTTGNLNTAIGSGSLSNNTTGASNTASGDNALQANTTGGNNTATGTNALQSNTTGTNNTGTGLQALQHNTTGSSNTASGVNALAANTTGGSNTANGFQALQNNTSGSSNAASGVNALAANTTGDSNTATGFQSLQANTIGTSNTATGTNALISNTTGSSNTASGTFALNSNTTGNSNTALGFGALSNSTTGSGNIALGNSAGQNISTGSNNIIIGNNGTGPDSATIRIGSAQTATFMAGITGTTTGNNNAVSVVVDSNGQLSTINSSRRFKEDIQDMGDASGNLLRLRPVTYRYKQPYADGSKPLDYGLIAEEVAEVYPDLVVTNKDGQVQTVQYQKLTPMLLNELQKQNETIRMLKEQIREQQEQNGKLESRLSALETLLSGGKVSNTAIAAR